jgi:hypothetical protein
MIHSTPLQAISTAQHISSGHIHSTAYLFRPYPQHTSSGHIHSTAHLFRLYPQHSISLQAISTAHLFRPYPQHSTSLQAISTAQHISSGHIRSATSSSTYIHIIPRLQLTSTAKKPRLQLTSTAKKPHLQLTSTALLFLSVSTAQLFTIPYPQHNSSSAPLYVAKKFVLLVVLHRTWEIIIL